MRLTYSTEDVAEQWVNDDLISGTTISAMPSPEVGPPIGDGSQSIIIMMTATERVDEALKQASIPFYGVYQDEESNWVIDFKPEATTQQRSDAVTIIAGLDLSEAGLAARENVRERERAADVIQNSIDKEEKLLKAVLLVALDEVNTIREWLASFKTEVAAATSLSDLKTRVGNLPAMPDRTAAQVKSAVLSKLSSGAAD